MRDLFDFKKPKTLPQAAVFYVVAAGAFWVLATAAETWLVGF
jgi:hypothetical protein